MIVFPVDFDACNGAIPDEYVNLFLNLLIHMVCGQLGYEGDIVRFQFVSCNLLFSAVLALVSALTD